MAVKRLAEPARLLTTLQNGDHAYEVTLGKPPSPEWRAAFLRPPPRLTSAHYLPDMLSLYERTITVRSSPTRLPSWLRRIDRWVAYANSVVAE